MMCDIQIQGLKIIFIFSMLFWTSDVLAEESELVSQFEKVELSISGNEIDKIVHAKLKSLKIQPAKLSSDAVFVRRIYLDLSGSLPPVWAVRSFLKNKNKNKRDELIKKLLDSKEYSQYFTMKWSDVLRIKSEHPINLWPNGVHAYSEWLSRAIKSNMPYDQFVRELLTSSGSNFRVPQVNFYRALQGKSTANISTAVALTFMGVRTAKMKKESFEHLQKFFSRVKFKSTAEWKEEIIQFIPGIGEKIKTKFPDGKDVEILSVTDPRIVFADWLITAENPYFSKIMVNRVWAWLMGVGLINEVDDIRKYNPASNPQLLAFLEKEFIATKYDIKKLINLIVSSHTYQSSSLYSNYNETSKLNFAYYAPRQLEAEVLIDAICKITGSRENYVSPVPEPFTYIPNKFKTIELADGSISSSFLVLFGRPARDTGLNSERSKNSTAAQRLHLLNSTHIHKKLKNAWTFKQILKRSKGNHKKLINEVYLNILFRYPSKKESETVFKYFKEKKLGRAGSLSDLVWALINSKEFIFRH